MENGRFGISEAEQLMSEHRSHQELSDIAASETQPSVPEIQPLHTATSNNNNNSAHGFRISSVIDTTGDYGGRSRNGEGFSGGTSGSVSYLGCENGTSGRVNQPVTASELALVSSSVDAANVGGVEDSNREAERSALESVVSIEIRDGDFDIDVTSDFMPNDDGIPGGRSITWYIHLMQWIILVSFLLAGSALAYLYIDTWQVECDRQVKIWTIIWFCRYIVQLISNLVITKLKLWNRNSPLWLLIAVRIVHVFGYLWVLFGFHVLYYGSRCFPETWAVTITKVIFWVTVSIYLLPFALYALLLLCLPLLIYFMVRFAVPQADRQPTPSAIRSQLEVKSYRDVVEALRREYQIDNYEPTPLGRGMSSLSHVLGNVTTLLSSSQSTLSSSAQQPVTVSNYRETDGEQKVVRNSNNDSMSSSLLMEEDRQAREAITIHKACPICMVDMDDDDEVTVMPCDSRHFFHRTCVEQWLEVSQVCPICRTNIVNLLTPSSETGSTGVSQRSGTDMERVEVTVQ